MPVRKRVPQEKILQEQPPFTPSEITMLQEKLESERSRLEERLHITGKTQSQRGRNEDSESIGSDNFSRETEYRIMANDRKRLELIDEALSNLAHGKYGICQECGKRIGINRLMAKPHAKFCITCKTEREKSGISDQEY